MLDHKILVTGANGLLGFRLIKLLSQNCEVHALVRRMPEQLIDGVYYHLIDLGQPWNDKDLPSGIDTIYHLAQSSKFREFPKEALDIFRVNVDSTASLLDFAARNNVKKFVYASSGGVYGTGAGTFHENAPIVANNPLGYYLGSKLCGEILVQSYAPIMQIVVLRFFFMYGPEQRRSMLIPRLVDNVQNGIPIILQGQNGIQINPIHVSDAANMLVSILGLEESCALNIAGSEIYSIRQVAEIAGTLIGRSPIFDIQDKEPQNLVANVDAIKNKGWHPQISLTDGLKELL